jgi:hypothetical protein
MYTSETLTKAKKYVNKLLFPLEQHYYHSYHHAIEVMDRATYLAKKEKLNEEQIEILGIA